MTSQQTDDAASATNEDRWRALAVCLVAGFMTLLDVSIVNVALPAIAKGIHASSSDLQWIVSGYALTFGLVLVPSGRLGDVLGRRTMFIIGVLVFGVSSLACGLAPNPTVLVIARLVQGVGGGILNPQVSGLIQEMFSGAERGRAFGLLGATIGISTAVGPITGGAILSWLGDDAGWRWIFLVNIPIVIAAVILARLWLPPAKQKLRELTADLDPVGVLLLGATVVLLLLPLVQNGQRGSQALPWWLAVIGVVCGAGFVWWERRYRAQGGDPLVDLSLFSVPGYTPGAVIGTVYFAGFTGIFFVLTIHFQESLGYSPLLAGLAVTPFAAGSAVTSALSGRLVARFGRALITGGLLLVLIGLIAVDVVLVNVHGSRTGWALFLPLLVAGLGSGFVISPNVTLTLNDVPVRRAGTAGGMLQTGQRIGTAAGIALVGSVFFSSGTGGPGGHDGASAAIRVTALLVLVALVASLIDLRNRAHPHGRHEPGRTADSVPS
ncbi:MFS transporter [Branchiibius sp. NY16-3462-2]|uniref:MFS transporter n=1 Tax=Branchiibius sp. NY16-3462-2 TaxID=1807500 RepID=UPI0025B7E993|nr:MFS transporter [Branchiibius sp. NY16-3462-2]